MSDLNVSPEVGKDWTLEELFKMGLVSIRCYNALEKEGLTCMSLIVDFYNRKRTFWQLRNIGRMSCDRLEKLCLEYGSTYITNPPPILTEATESYETRLEALSKRVTELENQWKELDDRILTLMETEDAKRQLSRI